MSFRKELLILLFISTVGYFVAYCVGDYFDFQSGQPAQLSPCEV